MNFEPLIKSLSINDGSVPTIIVGFGNKKVVAEAYDLIKSIATSFPASQPHYWSLKEFKDIKIEFNTNPAIEFMNGNADPFHVWFTGVISPSGFKVPDLGVHVLDVSEIEIDISLGEGWDNQSVAGLFEILNLLKQLSADTIFKFEASKYHPSGELFLNTFQSWLTEQSSPSKPQ
jgi:hypothetical protein